MFYGTYEHALDDKARLIIPAKFRDALHDTFSQNFMMCPGLESCIFLYTLAEWRILEERLKNLPSLSAPHARGFMRRLFAGATQCDMDKQGRILVPNHLRKHAAIERDVVITGVSNRVEIWSRDRWREYLEKQSQAFEETAERLNTFGI